MTLQEFLRVASKRERSEIAEVCHDSVGYLYQIAGGHRYASALMARRIEAATRRLAARYPDRFRAVGRHTLVKHPEIFDNLDDTGAESQL